MPDYGKSTEDLIEAICTKMFFSDFTVRNPIYKKASGHEKEAADFLVPFGENLIAFQVKAKEETKDAHQRTAIDHSRIQRRVNEGISQLKTIQEAVRNKRFASLKTVRGIEIPFDCSKVKKIIGVVILDLIGEERLSREDRTGILGGFGYIAKLPVHVFMRDDFQAMSEELDTVPDFTAYLETREKLWSRGILSPVTDELDLLAIYKTRVDHIQQFLSGKIGLVVITGDIWKSYQKKRGAIDKRNAYRFPSYIVDDVIQWLHTSIGFELKGIEIQQNRLAHRQGTVEGYVSSILELASMTRIERRGIGERFLDKMQKADAGDFRYGAIVDRKKRYGYVVASSNVPREERAKRLYALCATVYCKHKLKKIIGLASEPLKARARSYDVITLNGVGFKNRWQLARQAKRMFGREEGFHVEEYKETEIGELRRQRFGRDRLRQVSRTIERLINIGRKIR